MISPSPQYDYQNEANFRSDLEKDALATVRTNRATPFLLMIDEDTNEVMRVSIKSGAWSIVPA